MVIIVLFETYAIPIALIILSFGPTKLFRINRELIGWTSPDGARSSHFTLMVFDLLERPPVPPVLTKSRHSMA